MSSSAEVHCSRLQSRVEVNGLRHDGRHRIQLGSKFMSEVAPSEVVRQNREYWERLAPHRQGEPVQFFSAGGTMLTEAETAAVGDLNGRRFSSSRARR